MSRALADVDGILRAEGRFAADERAVPFGRIVAIVVAGGFVHGAVMGSFAGRALQMAFSGVKVPLLLLGTSAIVLPSFFVLNTLAGLRDDFHAALRAVLAAQAVVALALASFAPLSLVAYATFTSPEAATRVEFALFAAATLAGHLGSAKFYRALIRRDRKHAVLRVAWTALYVFVAIQLAWVCRPFIGDPRLATSFLREDAWSNAYVTVARQLLGG